MNADEQHDDFADPACACGHPVEQHGLACDDCSLIFPGRSEMASHYEMCAPGGRGASGERAPGRGGGSLGGARSCSCADEPSPAELVEPSVRRRYVELAKNAPATSGSSGRSAHKEDL